MFLCKIAAHFHLYTYFLFPFSRGNLLDCLICKTIEVLIETVSFGLNKVEVTQGGWPEFRRQNFQSINFSIDFPLIDLDLKRFGQLSIETFEYVISSPGFDFGYLLLHFSKGTPL